jgi:hypothetical protein
MKHKTRIYFDDFVNAVHNCDRRSQFSIVNVRATPPYWALEPLGQIVSYLHNKNHSTCKRAGSSKKTSLPN